MTKATLSGKIGRRPSFIKDENIAKTLRIIIDAVDELSEEIEKIKQRLPALPEEEQK